jgi:hypothetical protein
VCVCVCIMADGTTPAAGTTLYIVGEGSVRVIVAHAKDGEIVQEHGPGAFFGEIAFLATCAQVFQGAGTLPQDLDAQLKVVIVSAHCSVSRLDSLLCHVTYDSLSVMYTSACVRAPSPEKTPANILRMPMSTRLWQISYEPATCLRGATAWCGSCT